MSYQNHTTPAYDAALMLRRATYYLGLAFALTPVKWGDKIPAFGKGWNRQENLITTPEQAAQRYARPFNIGVALGASGINSLDIDDMELTRTAFAERGIDLDAVLAEHPHVIQGAGLRLWFRAGESDPIQSRRYLSVDGVTAYEIRGGNGFQDVAPGSLHPNGYEYKWAKTPPRTRTDLPGSPQWLYALYETLRERPEKAEKARASIAPREYTGPSVIEAYNARYTVEEVLERNGYKRRGDRYLSPNSKSKLAGVTVYSDNGKGRAVSHHTSDVWADRHGHDAFDLFTLLEHDEHQGRALEAARTELGMERQTPLSSPPEQYTDAEVTAAWELHTPHVLEEAAALLAPQMHHRALGAVMDLLGYIYQSAAEGHTFHTPHSGRALLVGGVKGLASLIGGHPTDIRTRLDFLTDKGMLRVDRVDPTDPKSAVQILLPPSPLGLPFLAQLKEASKSPKRPLTREVRKDRKFILPPCKEERLRGGRIKNPLSLRALSRVALTLSQHPGLTLVDLAARLNMRLPTLRRKVSELGELGYLTEGGALRCSFREFFQDMRAEEGEATYHRVNRMLGKRKDYFARRLMLARLGITEDVEVPSIRRRLARTERQIERLGDGEAPHMVLGRAS